MDHSKNKKPFLKKEIGSLRKGIPEDLNVIDRSFMMESPR
jgi:hypothetical protein